MIMEEAKFIEPMKPILYPQVFDDDNFLYQVKWDGVRMLSYVTRNQVILSNKNLKNKTMQFPELAALSKIITGKQAILDGELIVLKDGKPHFPSILQRNFCNTSAQIESLCHELPITYMIFDVIRFNDNDLSRDPLEQRISILNECLNWQRPFYAVECFSDGPGLFAAVKKQELEGIVAKRKSSHYVSGNKHKDWLKIKYRRRKTFVIGGYTCNNNRINALLVGLHDKSTESASLHFVGRVGTGLKHKEWDLLSEKLPEMKIGQSPFINLRYKERNEAQFIKPVLTIEIEFAELTDSLHLRAPAIIGFSSVSPEECRF